jgi:peptide-methionine (S)-S-oxide reductase
VEKQATFGAGCFWGVEAAFRQLDGVTKTEVGYEGGTLDNPTYEDVCSHTTGHAEVVRVTYDPERISYEDLLRVFWDKHNPTQLNRQGWDIGDQYRSAIFTTIWSRRRSRSARRRRSRSATGRPSSRRSSPRARSTSPRTTTSSTSRSVAAPPARRLYGRRRRPKPASLTAGR